MKQLDPSSKRFVWSYDRVMCYDTKCKRRWILAIRYGEPRRYRYISLGAASLGDKYYARKATAVRGLMRYIAAQDPK